MPIKLTLWRTSSGAKKVDANDKIKSFLEEFNKIPKIVIAHF